MQRYIKALHSPDEDKQSENFSKMVIEEADIVKPIIKEQLFKEYIMGTGDSSEIFNIYCKTFGVDEKQKGRMILIHSLKDNDSEELFFFRNVAEKSLGAEHITVSTLIKDCVLLITDITDKSILSGELDKIRRLIKACYNNDVTLIYSADMRLAEAPVVYRKLFRCREYSFYASDFGTMYEKDIKINTGEPEIKPEYDKIEKAVLAGNSEDASELITRFFDEIEKATPVPCVAKTYCLELYVCIIRCCEVDKIDKYMKGIASVQEGSNLSKIREIITEKAEEIVLNNAPVSRKHYSTLIEDTLDVIDKNISNENLSLRWLAGNILYTNVDYLGKLFKKEMGKNFSHYVMEKRMEMAKRLIVDGRKDRIYEVAEKVGYGSNPQYFSQVFKKYTGASPLEYKEYARTHASNF